MRISFSRSSRPSALPFGFIPFRQVAAGAGTSSPPPWDGQWRASGSNVPSVKATGQCAYLGRPVKKFGTGCPPIALFEFGAPGGDKEGHGGRGD